MTEVAAPIDRARSDSRPPVSPAEVAGLQEACATAAAIHSALELGVLARVSEGPADRAGVAADCGLTQQGAHSTFRRWLGAGGFDDARRHDLPGPFPFTLITGRRR